jgi:glycosyltransferase involved in cell wall biosynthesis
MIMAESKKISSNKTVSVIIPTCNRYEVLLRNIHNIRRQTYPVEIIVCDDTDKKYLGENKNQIKQIKEQADKYFYTALYDHEGKKVYGLGRARNRGVIEASGEFIVFLDDRITPANNEMIHIFANKLQKHGSLHWLFGDKGAHKTSFVENCSAVRRKELIISGMFSETINSYGYMTREIFSRHKKQGFKFVFIKEALAKPICSGSRRNDTERARQITYSKNILRQMGLI